MRTCRHHWRMLRHSTAEETSNPGGRSPSRCLSTCSAAAVDGPRGRPIPKDGQPNIRRQVWLLHHSWRRALTQCRARSTSQTTLSDGQSVASSFLSARGMVSAHLLSGRHTRVSILNSLAGSGRFCWQRSGFAGSDLPNAAALTLRIGLAARVPFRAVERLISPTHRTFGPRLATASMVSR